MYAALLLGIVSLHAPASLDDERTCRSEDLPARRERDVLVLFEEPGDLAPSFRACFALSSALDVDVYLADGADPLAPLGIAVPPAPTLFVLRPDGTHAALPWHATAHEDIRRLQEVFDALSARHDAPLPAFVRPRRASDLSVAETELAARTVRLLIVGSEGARECGGALVTSRLILTAGHCLAGATHVRWRRARQPASGVSSALYFDAGTDVGWVVVSPVPLDVRYEYRPTLRDRMLLRKGERVLFALNDAERFYDGRIEERRRRKSRELYKASFQAREGDSGSPVFLPNGVLVGHISSGEPRADASGLLVRSDTDFVPIDVSLAQLRVLMPASARADLFETSAPERSVVARRLGLYRTIAEGTSAAGVVSGAGLVACGVFVLWQSQSAEGSAEALFAQRTTGILVVGLGAALAATALAGGTALLVATLVDAE